MSDNIKKEEISINQNKKEEILSITPDLISNKNSPIQNSHSQICDFILKDKLGEGTFGIVRLGINKQTNEKVAIKIMDKLKILQYEDKTRVEREIKILKCLRHPNIVHLYNVIQSDKSIYLIMEYISGKELFDYITTKKKLDEIEACKFYQQIISGIEYMNKLKIVHRDIKPENLLLDDKNINLKIVDFGLSNIYNNKNNQLLKSACGSPSYAAPEMLNGKEYKASKVDIWSSGIVLFAMICGFLPFENEDNDNEKLYKKIIDGKFNIPNFVSELGKDLIKRILVTNPNLRFNINQIKSHPWFNLYRKNGRNLVYEGLLINTIVIPIDENVVIEMGNKFKLNLEEIRSCILSNRHNDICTLYYLILKKKLREGKKSIADLKSDLFQKYIDDKDNLYKNYNCDFNKVIEARKYGVIKEKERTQKRKVKSLDNNNIQSKRFSLNFPNNKIYKYRIKSYKNDNSRPLSKKNNDKSSESSINKDINYLIPNMKKIDKEKQWSTERKISITENNKIHNPIKNYKMNINDIDDRKNYNTDINSNNSNFNFDFNKNNLIQKKINSKRINQYLTSHQNLNNPMKKFSINSFIQKNDNFIPVDLITISFKSKTVLKDSLLQSLKLNKIKYRTPTKNKFIIDILKEGLIIEINISEDDEIPNANIFKIKRIRGTNFSYWKLSRLILSKIDL
jgi:5'-AMP-activated protein kinase catalytic alpha subunit